MSKQTIQITQANFTVLVMELEEAIKKGYSLVKEGENRPYHAIMGNFILTLEKEDVSSTETEVVKEAEAPKPATQQRGPRPKK